MTISSSKSFVKINFIRVNKEPTTYTEGFVEETETRLKTFNVVPEPYRSAIAAKWISSGLLQSHQQFYSITKYLFYHEGFTILEIRGETELLGYYCDITLPMQKVGDEYLIHDLMLDLWIDPQGTVTELDWDEFEEAVEADLISDKLRQKAIETLERLKQESAQGIFPSAYIG